MSDIAKHGKPPKVRTDEAARLTSAAFNERTGERHYINEVRFSFYNHAIIKEAIESGRAIDLVKLPKQKDKTVLIIGSGPTLNEALPLLKDWRGEIVCSTSQASTLVHFGREPEHIVALDPDSRPEELFIDSWEGRKSTLHVHPGVDPELIRWWKGPIALFRKLQPQTPFYATTQNIGYGTLGPKEENRWQGNKGEPFITGQIPMLACAIPVQICVAKHIGYRQQYLLGCDFSYPGKIPRFTDWHYIDGQWDETPIDFLNFDDKLPDPTIETEYDGLCSSTMMIFYSHQVVIAWRITEADIINTSRVGLLRMFPYVPLQEVLKRQNKGVKSFTIKQIHFASEEYLAKQNIYFLCIGKGVMPHEFKDPLHEIPRMIEQVKATLDKQGRGNELDVEANMKRIRRLFDKVSHAL